MVNAGVSRSGRRRQSRTRPGFDSVSKEVGVLVVLGLNTSTTSIWQATANVFLVVIFFDKNRLKMKTSRLANFK
jgi:hypothetical protein